MAWRARLLGDERGAHGVACASCGGDACCDLHLEVCTGFGSLSDPNWVCSLGSGSSFRGSSCSRELMQACVEQKPACGALKLPMPTASPVDVYIIGPTILTTTLLSLY